MTTRRVSALSRQIPADIDDYAANLTEFRVATDPGAVGAESLPVSLAGELERLRYVLKQFIGGTWWYDLANRCLTSIKGISITTTQAKNLRGEATLSSGTVNVTFATAEPDDQYVIVLGGNANETFRWSAKGTGGFTITSSNGSSTALVDWVLIR